jgi:hypothetical protein
MAGAHQTIATVPMCPVSTLVLHFGAGVANAQAEVGTFFDQGREYR